MTTRRSFIETLNAGRPKRAGSTLEDIAQSLQKLESRFDRSPPDGDPQPVVEASSIEAAAPPEMAQPHPQDAKVAPAARDIKPSAYQSIVRDIDQMRQKEVAVASAGMIAEELKTLRDEMRQQMALGIREEFDSLRVELGQASLLSGRGVGAEEGKIAQDIERLSDAVQSIAQRGDEHRVGLLRGDIEDLRQALDRMARDSGSGAADRRWDDFDRRWMAFEAKLDAGRKTADPQIGALTDRLQAISSAVEKLPESLSMRSLEERVRMLSSSVELFMMKQEDQAPETLRQLEERLDEISRAIVASAVSTAAPAMDPEPFERIEARISSLARQIEEVMTDRPTGEVLNRIGALAQRVDALAARDAMPDQAIDLLARQLTLIADKLERVPAMPEANALFDGIEQRFELFSTMVERRQGEAIEHGNAIFRDLERRLEEIAVRIDLRGGGESLHQGGVMDAIDSRFGDLAERLVAENRRVSETGRKAIDAVESRLVDISLRLDASSAKVGNVDPKLIRSLESQIAALSAHLQRPAASLPVLDDIGPRLGEIEKAITGNRDSIVSAAREAAEAAVRSLGAVGMPESNGLANDLKSLENLTRRSDERNAKTFEAIHDTLIKIVDRLGAFETARSADMMASGRSAGLRGTTPQHEQGPNFASQAAMAERPVETAMSRSPAQAAADAASAALGRTAGPAEKPSAPRSKLLGGLARAFKKEAAPEVVAVEPPAAPADASPGELDMPLDVQAANRPLEPGSGTPDVNTIMRRFRDEKAGFAKAADSDAARSDFIAAARRAAQAAAAEAEVTKRNALNPARAETLKIGDLVKTTRKPVLMAATALLVVLSGLQIGKAYLTVDNAETDASTTRAEANAVASPSEPIGSGMASPVTAPAAPTGETENAAPAAMPAIPAAPAVAAADAGNSDATKQGSMAGSEAPMAKPTTMTPSDDALSPISATPKIAAAEPSAMPDTEAAGMPVDEPTTVPAAAEPAKTAEPPVAAPAPTTAKFEIPVEAGPVPLREAAAAGDPKALYEVASRYADGRGVKADMTQAAGWYVKAAQIGLPTAEYRAGNVYEKGLGVDRDTAKAKAFYEQAADHGNVSAMHNLAVLYAMGSQGAPDNPAAVRWFTQAADYGVKDSQFNLGILTAKGVGTKQDLEQSYKWFAIVAKTGDRDAASKRDEIANSLRPEQLERARAIAESWKAKPVDVAANSVEIPDSWKEVGGATAGIDMKKAVGNIQRILNKNGYDAGGADGMMGDKTKQAIKSFQKDNGMTSTGEVDEKLVRALLAKK